MEIMFGGIQYRFTTKADGVFCTINRLAEYGFSGFGRDHNAAVVNAVKDVLESAVIRAEDLELHDLAIESLACAYAAGITKEFTPMGDTMFVYRGAIYYLEIHGDAYVVFRHLDGKPIPLTAFAFNDEGKLWASFAEIEAKKKAETYKEVEEILNDL